MNVWALTLYFKCAFFNYPFKLISHRQNTLTGPTDMPVRIIRRLVRMNVWSFLVLFTHKMYSVFRKKNEGASGAPQPENPHHLI